VAVRNGNAKGDFSIGSAPSYSHARRWKLASLAAGTLGEETMTALRSRCNLHSLGTDVQTGPLTGGPHMISLFSKLYKTG
jgi:hypothetical protein